jgi:broad specificity phosphatase PhoE
MSDQELINSGFNIDANYRSQVKSLRSSENEYEYYERSKETMKRLIKLHRKTGGTILLVAHAPSLEVLTRHLMNGQPRPERLSDLAGKVGYCSMTIVDGGPTSKSWQFRYSLDERANQQQIQQLHRAATMNYVPTAMPANYTMTPIPTSQFQYLQ